MRLRVVRAVAAASVVLSPAMASAVQTSAGPCLQREEAENLVVFVLPSLIDGMARKCGPMLPATATLPRSGTQIAGRYRADSLAAWPKAKLAFAKMSGGAAPEYLSDTVQRAVIEEATAAAIVADFKPKSCRTADRFVTALSPLPAQNVGSLIALLMEIGAAEDKSPMRICAAEDGK